MTRSSLVLLVVTTTILSIVIMHIDDRESPVIAMRVMEEMEEIDSGYDVKSLGIYNNELVKFKVIRAKGYVIEVQKVRGYLNLRGQEIELAFRLLKDGRLIKADTVFIHND